MLLVAEPSLGEEEKAALAEVVESGWITMGDRVRAFEIAFAESHGAPDAVAVSSCTAGLHLILEALGLGPGDEVLVPALTFVATANAVRYTGATPVFVDIVSLDLPLLSRADAEAKCTRNTKAAIVMHYGGYLVDGESWRGFAAKHGLILVEDAAHAVGVLEAGRVGEAAVFSFFGNKNMTTAEGGMIVARDAEVLARVRQMRSHGMTSSTKQRMATPNPSYDVTMLGFNYRMDELRAAVGLVQLGKLLRWNEKRKNLTATYRDALSEYCPEVMAPFDRHRPSSHHIMPIVLPAGSQRDTVMGRMREDGIQTTVHYPPVHLFSLYRNGGVTASLPYTEEFARRELTVPLHQRLEGEQVEAIAVSLAKALAN